MSSWVMRRSPASRRGTPGVGSPANPGSGTGPSSGRPPALLISRSRSTFVSSRSGPRPLGLLLASVNSLRLRAQALVVYLDLLALPGPALRGHALDVDLLAPLRDPHLLALGPHALAGPHGAGLALAD